MYKKFKVKMKKKFNFFFKEKVKKKVGKKIYTRIRRNKAGILIFKKVHSNYFVTFVDNTFKVIVCLTSGNCHVGDSKRKKISPYAMENITKTLITYLKLYKITNLYLYMYTKPSTAYFILIQQLVLNKINVQKIIERIHTPHNGIRGRKLRHN